jgi:hypothetical protein
MTSVCRLKAKIGASVHFRDALGCDPNRPRLEAKNIAKEFNDAWSMPMWSHQI